MFKKVLLTSLLFSAALSFATPHSMSPVIQVQAQENGPQVGSSTLPELQVEGLEAYPEYGNIIQLYYDIVNGHGRASTSDLNPHYIDHLTQGNDFLYFLQDVTGDGQDELFIGYDQEVYGIYSLLDGKAVNLLSPISQMDGVKLDIYEEGYLFVKQETGDEEGKFYFYQANLQDPQAEVEEVTQGSYQIEEGQAVYTISGSEAGPLTSDQLAAELDLTDQTPILLKPDQTYNLGKVFITGEEASLESTDHSLEASVSGSNDSTGKFAVNHQASIIDFHRDGMNIPTNIQLLPQDNQIEIGNQVYEATYDYVPDTQIRVFSADDSGDIRSVTVNSRIQIGQSLSGESSDAAGSEAYVFKNKQGNLSLATINFAGNVGPDMQDVMMEYLETAR
ncbi:hypothetical protein ACWOBE_08515 [Hutsoniella sourekii]